MPAGVRVREDSQNTQGGAESGTGGNLVSEDKHRQPDEERALECVCDGDADWGHETHQGVGADGLWGGGLQGMRVGEIANGKRRAVWLG
jgi:hypothetical protein